MEAPAERVRPGSAANQGVVLEPMGAPHHAKALTAAQMDVVEAAGVVVLNRRVLNGLALHA